MDKEFDKIAESDIVLEKIDEFSKDIDFDKHTDEVNKIHKYKNETNKHKGKER